VTGTGPLEILKLAIYYASYLYFIAAPLAFWSVDTPWRADPIANIDLPDDRRLRRCRLWSVGGKQNAGFHHLRHSYGGPSYAVSYTTAH